MKWNAVEITPRFTIACRSRRFVKRRLRPRCDCFFRQKQGISRGLGRAEGGLGWHVFPRGLGCKSPGVDVIEILPSSRTETPCQVDTAESTLLITEPYFNLPNLQDVYDQFVF